MTGFSAYYLQNPFLFLLIFVKNEYIPAALYYIEALQLSLAGLTFQVYITKSSNKGSLVFSTAYALLGYSVGYFTLPIYFNNIIMLPLVILGLFMIFDGEYKKGSLLYIITLALSIFFNYYLAYMLCIFLLLCAMWLTAIFVASAKDKMYAKREVFIKIKVFIVSSVGAVLLSLFSLLPTVLSLSGQKSAPQNGALGFFRMYRIFDSFSALFTGSYNGNVANDGFPLIYIGVVPAFFAICYFLNKKIDIKERIITLIFIAAMIISLNIHTFNVIWHAFNEPVGFGYRFAFLLSFLLLTVGYKGYLNDSDRSVYFIAAAAVLLYAMYGLVFHRFMQPMYFIAADVCLVVGVVFAKVIPKLKSFSSVKLLQNKALISSCIAVLCILEIMLNGMYSLKTNINDAKTVSEYTESYERMKSIIDEIKSSDDGFYRIEKDFMLNLQDAMTFDYTGLTHNSSCETDTVKSFMGKMGFRNQGIWAFYNQGSTTFADILLGVKYFVSRFDTTDKPYEAFSNVGKNYVYKNQYALPLAFLADTDALKNVDMETHDLFEIQNNIADIFGAGDIYEKSEITDIKVCNLEIDDQESGGGTEYKKIDSDLDAYVEFDVRSRGYSHNLYFYFDAPHNQSGIKAYVNDVDYDYYFTEWRFNIVRAGRFQEGDIVKIKLAVEGDSLLLTDYYIYDENISTLEKLDECIHENGFNDTYLEKLSSSKLKGSINVPDNDNINYTVIYSIPYDEGWHIKIDGKRVNMGSTLDALLAVDLDENGIGSGSHELYMYFMPKGIIIGCVVSLIALICVIFIYTDKKYFFKGER